VEEVGVVRMTGADKGTRRPSETQGNPFGGPREAAQAGRAASKGTEATRSNLWLLDSADKGTRRPSETQGNPFGGPREAAQAGRAASKGTEATRSNLWLLDSAGEDCTEALELLGEASKNAGVHGCRQLKRVSQGPQNQVSEVVLS
jgi:hypothetical protein